MEKFKHLNDKTVELAAISASIAGGCVPCLNYHFKKAIETGCTLEQACEAVELGSVKFIHCRQMQSVMKSIEVKYGKEVKIDFYDVWTDAGNPVFPNKQTGTEIIRIATG